MNPQLMTDEALAELNEDLATVATPMGAYCMGIVCALAWDVGRRPPRSVLQAAARCVDLKDAVDWYRLTKVLHGAGLE